MDHVFNFMQNHVLHFVSTIPNHLTCTICRNILIDSHFAPCGCKFCLNCVTQYLLDGCKVCPSGKDECADIVLDLAMNITKDSASDVLIWNSIVRCPYNNCDHQLRLKAMPEHVNICSSRPIECEFNAVGCDKRVAGGSDMENHLLMENVDHMQMLLRYLRKMDNKVRQRINAIELRLEETGGLNDRLVREWQVEENQLLASVREMKNEMDDMKSIDQHTGNEMQTVIRENEELEKKIQCLKKTIEDFEKKLKENDENVTKKLEEMEKTMKEKEKHAAKTLMKEMTVTMETRQSEQSKKMRQSQARMKKEIRLQVDVTKYRLQKEINRVKYNEFVWRVEKLKDSQQKAANNLDERIYSEHFYSHRNGYRLKLSMYPNGIGNGKGTHLSLFFEICKGRFDDVVQWPMNKTIRLAILNQTTGLEHIGYDFNYEKFKDIFPEAFEKSSKSDSELGNQQFISWDELQKSDDVIVNDVLFIQCSFAD